MTQKEDAYELTYEQILRRLRDILERPTRGEATAESLQASGERRSIIVPRIQAVADDRGELPEDDFSDFARRELGDLGELAFSYKAAKQRVPSAKPHSQNLPFDSVAIAVARQYLLHKIQVRCTAFHRNYIYAINMRHSGGKKKYVRGDFDYMAALIVPEDAWYIIPFNKLPLEQRAFTLHPREKSKSKLGPWDKYRDRWDLLR